MKTKYFFVVFVIAFFFSNTLQSQWVKVADFPYDKFTDVFFLNKDTGFVSGGNYADPDLCRTFDGGISWQTISQDISGVIVSLSFINSQEGFLISAQDLGVWLYKTTDLGENWEQVSEFTLVSYGISFPAENTGYVIQSVTENAMITKSVDGGNTWEVINSFWTEWGGWGVTDFQFLTEDLGYMIFESGVAYKTTDGGLNFEEVYLDFNYNLYSLYFLDAENGFMVGEKKDTFGEDSTGVVMKTTNGGTDWIVTAFPGIGNDIAFLNADTGYIAAGFGMLETLDAGQSWHACDLDADYSLVSLNFPDHDNGYAVGNWSTSSGIYKLDYYAGMGEGKQVERKMSLFPNPADDYITLSIPGGSSLTRINVYDRLGRLVLHQDAGTGRIDISSVQPGVFFIEVLCEERVLRGKFIISR